MIELYYIYDARVRKVGNFRDYEFHIVNRVRTRVKVP